MKNQKKSNSKPSSSIRNNTSNKDNLPKTVATTTTTTTMTTTTTSYPQSSFNVQNLSHAFAFGLPEDHFYNRYPSSIQTLSVPHPSLPQVPFPTSFSNNRNSSNNFRIESICPDLSKRCDTGDYDDGQIDQEIRLDDYTYYSPTDRNDFATPVSDNFDEIEIDLDDFLKSDFNNTPCAN